MNVFFKNILFLFLFLTFAGFFIVIDNEFLFAQDANDDNDLRLTYFVFADGGLRMRKKPDVNAEMITLIPFGGMVTSFERTKKDETIAGKTAKWHRVTYQKTYSGKNDKIYSGWVFGGFLSDKNLIRKCNSLNVKSPFELSDYFYNLSEEASENSADYWVILPDGEANNFRFETNFTGRFFYYGLRASSYSIPFTWKFDQENIKVEGIKTVSLDHELSLCGNFDGGGTYEMVESCKDERKQEWIKKHGDKTEDSEIYIWTITFLKKGEVQVTTNENNTPVTWKCGY